MTTSESPVGPNKPGPAADDHTVDLPPVGGVPLLGHVAAFDDPRGIGVVSSGDRTFGFHCTAITDGSRRIDEGAPVAFTVGAGHLGRLQALSVRPLGAAAPGSPGSSGSPGSPVGRSTSPSVSPEARSSS